MTENQQKKSFFRKIEWEILKDLHKHGVNRKNNKSNQTK